MRVRRIAIACLLVVAGEVAAQVTPRPLSTGKPLAAYSEPFGLVNAVRELSTGEVMVADPLSGDLWLLEASLRTGRKIGREGSGPGEYRQPDAVWPMPGDSTLLVDLGNARLSIYSRSGTFGRSLPMVLGTFIPGAGPPATLIPRGVDQHGRIFFQGSNLGPNGPLDSAAVLRYDPATSRTDTIVLVKGPTIVRTESGGEDNRQVRIRPVPFAGGDGWAVAATGAVAVARTGQYRVDWVTPTGQRRHGSPVSHDRVRIGNAEKEEWTAFQQLVGGVGMRMENNDGRVSVSFARNRGGQAAATDGLQWPDYKPPFDNVSARVDPLGRLWVLRHGRALRGALNRYDVFGSDGALVRSYTLARNQRVVGFGARSVYVVSFDDDGLQTLERHALPT